MNLGASQGRFSVPLPALCVPALTTSGDAWAEVEVGATTLPRQRIGSVPFALVAREAQTADLARTVASGAVGETQLAPAVTSRIAAAEAEIDEVATDLEALGDLPHARFAMSSVMANTTLTQIANQDTIVDMAHEYDPANALFAASRAGLYLITSSIVTSNIADQCGVIFEIHKGGSNISADAGPVVMANQSLASGVNNVAGGVSYVVLLAVGDELTFWAQVVCAGTTVTADIQVTFLR